jgi:hypothetical protein
MNIQSAGIKASLKVLIPVSGVQLNEFLASKMSMDIKMFSICIYLMVSQSVTLQPVQPQQKTKIVIVALHDDGMTIRILAKGKTTILRGVYSEDMLETSFVSDLPYTFKVGDEVSPSINRLGEPPRFDSIRLIKPNRPLVNPER